MSGPSDESVAAEEKSLRAAIESEIPLGDQKAWDIPIKEGAMPARVMPRPDARNNPQTEMWSRLLSAVITAVIVGGVLLLMLVTDMDTLSGIFTGGASMTVSGIVMMAGLVALVSILLMLGLHLLARAFVKSRIPPRTMDLPQRALLEMLPSPVFFLDSHALIQDLNSAFVRALGQSAAGIVGKSFYDFIPKEHQEYAYQGLLKAISGVNGELRCPIITRAGTRTFQILAEPYKGHNSDEVLIIALATDVSDQVTENEALKNKYKILHSATLQTIETIASIVELRDPYLRGHHNRVGQIAKSLAQELNLPEDEVDGIEMAAQVHDVGTLNVPFEILIKPGEISEAEREIIRQHCQTGFGMLSKIDFSWPIAEIVLQHHENCDGSGYPKGLSGDDISIGARILAVADSYDAMISDRPFRAAVSRSEALQKLSNLSGKQYDPKVVAALFKILQVS